MIIERITFHAKYGQIDALVGLFGRWKREVAPMMRQEGEVRAYTDVTGPMFTLTVDFEYADLATYAAEQAKIEEAFGTKEFQDWFAEMQPLIDRAERQLLSSVDL